MKEEKMSIREAYLAMFEYLEKLYKRTSSEDLGGFLGSMELIDDDLPGDPAVWSDWLQAVQKAKKSTYNKKMHTKP